MAENFDIHNPFAGKIGLIFAAGIGLVASDIIPTPGDALYFYLNRKYRNQFLNGEITSKQYWIKESIIYYTLNSAWWLLVMLITLSIKGDWEKKLKVLLGITGGGIVLGTIIKNIRDDEKAIANGTLVNTEKMLELHLKTNKPNIKASIEETK